MFKKFICILSVAGILITGLSVFQTQTTYAKEINEYQIQETISSLEVSQIVDSGVSTYAVSSSTTGKWIKSSNGKWWYRHSDGTCTKNDWEKIDGKWYHFDSNGWMQTGWLKVDGKWYYLESSGAMHTGWLNLNDKWYYFESSGAMRIGWLNLNNKWYYLLSNGEMNIGWLNRNYKWYYFNTKGEMVIGWKEVNENWYYFDEKGVMATGWKEINGSWYYFLEKGYMNKNPLTLRSRYYEFESSGKLFLTKILINRQTQEKSKWCWAASSVMVGTYYTDSNITQRDVVKYIKGSIINEGGTDYETIDAINYASNFSKSASCINPLSYNGFVSRINDNHPIALHISWHSGGGHMIVGAGYNLKSRTIYSIDPWADTKTTFYDYASLMNGTNLLTGSGKCTSMVVY